jgi:hypothetical protein
LTFTGSDTNSARHKLGGSEIKLFQTTLPTLPHHATTIETQSPKTTDRPSKPLKTLRIVKNDRLIQQFLEALLRNSDERSRLTTETETIEIEAINTSN